MKKTITILLSFIMVMSLVACGNSTSQTEYSSVENDSAENGTANGVESSADDKANIESGTEDEVQTQTSDTQTETESAGQSENVNVSDTENAGLSETQQLEAETPEIQEKKVLVAYFSATGTTEAVAEHIANGLNADIYEIIPEEPYTDADLDYNDNNSRSTIEMNDKASRPAISGSVENMEQYDIVFIGYAGGIIGLN